MDLERIFEELATKRSASIDPADSSLRDELAALGVSIESGRAILDDSVELLDALAIRERLDDRATAWVSELCVVPHIGSTNTELVERCARGGVDGSVLMAEVQTAGRGRRGRGWVSPFGRNLALSLGVQIDRPVSELGALSLAVGVAVADALATFGMSGVELKWPNDVLFGRRKLCGILIELPRATQPADVVIGIGINVGGLSTVKSHVDQDVADVTEQVPDASRNVLAALVINAVLDFCRQFEYLGFDPIKPAYDALHRFQGEAVRVVTGSETIAGTVIGVTAEGALRLETASGTREFSGGEVSLRS